MTYIQVVGHRWGFAASSVRDLRRALQHGTPRTFGGACGSPPRCCGHATTQAAIWVAAADPLPATQAITGSLAHNDLRRAVLLSDGASRLVDVFGWPPGASCWALLDDGGPGELVRRVRAAKAADPQGRRWPGTKRSDDATATYLALDA